MKPSKEAYELFHEGAIALATLEENGMRVDVDYLKATSTHTAERINRIADKLKEDPLWTAWRKKYGSAANLTSPQQLAWMLFAHEGHKIHGATAGGKASVNEAALQRINTPFTRQYLKMKKLEKAKSTYLDGYIREVEDGYIHGFFNLHNVKTFRGSADSPNLENVPKRNKAIMDLVRRAFISRFGKKGRIVEFDYSQLEVRVAACYHKDPTMLRYLADGYDMHGDMAIECYRLPPKAKFSDHGNEGNFKDIRQQVKALFVFAEFYGDYYVSVTKSLWDAVGKYHLLDHRGRSLVEYLGRKGIQRRGDCKPDAVPKAGTFEQHIQEVERRFWDDRFPVYRDWKVRTWADYQKRGYLKTLTGFVVSGIAKRNEVINSPVQGDAYHCLLWSVIHINKELKRRKLKSVLINHIHDSIVADIHEGEHDEVIELVVDIMTKQIQKAWGWLITPLDVEVEEAQPGETWADIKKVA